MRRSFWILPSLHSATKMQRTVKRDAEWRDLLFLATSRTADRLGQKSGKTDDCL